MYASADNKPTVLIVDDTAINLEVLVEILNVKDTRQRTRLCLT